MIAAMERLAPCSVRELAEVLEMPPDRLYYHLRKLEAVELVREVEVREASTRPEHVYDLVADHLVVDPHEQSRPFLVALGQMYESALATAARLVRQATEAGRSRQGRHQEVRLKRHHVRLTRRSLAEVNKRLDELHEYLRTCDDDAGSDYSITLAMAPTTTE